jgi:hypothetical protein
VDWVDPTRPQAARIREILGAEGDFNVRHDRDVAEIREVLRATTASAEDFAAYAGSVGTAFDLITDAILSGPGGAQVWTDRLVKQFKEADSLWNDGPFPPVQHAALHQALSTYYSALLGHEFVAVYRKDKLAPAVVDRLLKKTETQLRDYRGSWRVFLRR